MLFGLSGKISVNGLEYNSVMSPMAQHNDDEIANILTYALNAWGNRGAAVSAAEVAALRAAGPPPAGAAR